MTTYEIPDEPKGPHLWSNDANTGEWIKWRRMQAQGMQWLWYREGGGDMGEDWLDLLSVGPLTDEEPITLETLADRVLGAAVTWRQTSVEAAGQPRFVVGARHDLSIAIDAYMAKLEQRK